MIINIRGTSGSGKSSLVRQAMSAWGPFVVGLQNPLRKKATPLVYRSTMPRHGRQVSVLGSYETPCGGCDTIPTQDMICDLVRQEAALGHHVLLEGLLMSHLYGRYTALADEQTALGHPFIFGFLDTPIGVCLDRINARRRERGNDEPVNPRNTETKFRSILGCRAKLDKAGYLVVALPWQEPLTALDALLAGPVRRIA